MTKHEDGPGVLIDYNETNQTMQFKVAMKDSDTKLKVWSVKLQVYTLAWYQVILTFNKANGLQVSLNGFYEDEDYGKDPTGSVVEWKAAQGKTSQDGSYQRFTYIITIAQPTEENIGNETLYGQFDMSHLVIYKRDLGKRLVIKKCGTKRNFLHSQL
jgi:hypothetical protein